MSLGRAELERIKGLPRCHGPTPEEALALQREWVRPEAYAEGYRLLEGQVYGLWSYLKYGGVVGALGVGQGKTLLALMIVTAFHRANPGSNSMILLPPDLVKQLWVQDIPWAKTHFQVDVPVVSLGKQRKTLRKALCAGVKGSCFLYPYSLLSTSDGQELPRLIDADLVVADEAHCLTGDSARAKRWWDWVTRTRVENPPVGVCLSGTLLRKSIVDYYRVAKWAMAERSPMPRVMSMVTTWSEGLQSIRDDATEKDWVPHTSSRALAPLCKWAGVEFRGRPRLGQCQEAYRRRLYSAPGFVPAAEGSVAAGLKLRNRELKPSPELLSMMADVERDWIDPAGEPILYAIEKHELLRELSAGIWLRKYWPDMPGSREARDAHQAKGAWLRELRAWHGSRVRPPEGLDTPGLVHEALSDRSGGLSERLSDNVVITWDEWQAKERRVPEGAPGRETEVQLLDPYKVNAMVEYAVGGFSSLPRRMGGIIWHQHEAVGDWCEAKLREAGQRVLRKGAGANWLRDDGSEKFWVVASIGAHGTGRNLQHMAQAQWIMQLPGAGTTEQLLGRVHRAGVERYGVDVVEVATCLSTPWDWEQARRTLRVTQDHARLHGGSRKLTIADYCPPWT